MEEKSKLSRIGKSFVPSSKQKALLKRAKKIAISNGNGGRHRFGAILSKNGNVISEGQNKVFKSHTRPGYHRSIHAELHALIRSATSTEGSTMYIVRVSKKGFTKLARPCELCQQLLKEAGVSKVVYSLNGGGYAEEPPGGEQ